MNAQSNTTAEVAAVATFVTHLLQTETSAIVVLAFTLSFTPLITRLPLRHRRTFLKTVIAHVICTCYGHHTVHVQLCSKWLTGISPAGGFADSSVRIYDLEKMAASRGQASDDAAAGGSAVSHLWGHSGAIYGLNYSPDQQLLYTSSADGTVRLWSTELAVNLVAYRYRPLYSVSS